MLKSCLVVKRIWAFVIEVVLDQVYYHYAIDNMKQNKAM